MSANTSFRPFVPASESPKELSLRALLLGAFFGNVLETPAGAIPFYLTLGLVVGPTLSGFSFAAGEGRIPPSLTASTLLTPMG